MPDGNLFVGWGALPYISEFSPSGALLFNAQFPANVSTHLPPALAPGQLAPAGFGRTAPLATEDTRPDYGPICLRQIGTGYRCKCAIISSYMYNMFLYTNTDVRQLCGRPFVARHR